MLDAFAWALNEFNMYFWFWMQKNFGWKICSEKNFIQHDSTWLLSSVMRCWMKSTRLNRSNISSNIRNFACWMKCWTRLSHPWQRIYFCFFSKNIPDLINFNRLHTKTSLIARAFIVLQYILIQNNIFTAIQKNASHLKIYNEWVTYQFSYAMRLTEDTHS